MSANRIGCPRQDALKGKYNCNIPWAILPDPSVARNLHCTGCWAAAPGKRCRKQ